jgi:hypothetical protein
MVFSMVNDAMRIFAVKPLVASPLVSAKHANFVRHSFVHKRGQGLSANVLNNPSHNVALTAHSADNLGLARTNAAGSAALSALVLMFVLGEAADERFVNFDNADEPTLESIFH